MLPAAVSVCSGLLFAGLVMAKQPNILFIMTDDQDLHMTPTNEFMPHLQVRSSPKVRKFI